MKYISCLIAVALYLGLPYSSHGQPPPTEDDPRSRIEELEAERAGLVQRVEEIESQLTLLRAQLSTDSGASAEFHLKVDTFSSTVFQAPYKYSTPVKVSGQAWELKEGDAAAIIGGYDGPLDDYWRISKDGKVGYVRDVLVEIYKGDTELSYAEKDDLIENLDKKTRRELASSFAEKEFVVIGVFPDGPNSAGGVGAKIVYRHLNPAKVIKYLVFTVAPFNAVGDQVYGRLSRGSQQKLKVTGPIEASDILKDKYHEESFWGPLWYNSSIDCLRLDRVDIEY